MGSRFSKLRCKEVINVCDGARLGYVTDVEVDCCSGHILALVVPCRCRGFGSRKDYVIPWACVRRMGDDIILVEGDPEKFCLPRPKKDWF